MLSLALLAIAFAKPIRAEWSNSLKPLGPPAGEVLLVKDGKPSLPICLATDATTIERNAAAELQHWIEQITAARPQIVAVAKSPAMGLQTDATLGEEGYRISLQTAI